LQLGSTGNKLAAGLLWGLLPCGIVYSMLALALSAGNAAAGAAIMLSFGLGTLPFVLGSGGVVLAAAPLLRQPLWRKAAGTGLILYGVYGMATTLIP
jgi:sulfite exporter TauE/SafE